MLAARAVTRVAAACARWSARGPLLEQGAHKVIVGTAAFTAQGIDEVFLQRARAAIAANGC